MQLTSLPGAAVKNLHILCVLLQHLSQEFKHLLVRKFSNEKAYSAIFLAFLMYGRATDILARRWCCEECAGEHMLQGALGVKTELFPEWGK